MIDAAIPLASYTVAGTGPYTLPWPYQAGGVSALILQDEEWVPLSSYDFTVSPEESDTNGTLTLGGVTATTYTGAALHIFRATPQEQGFSPRPSTQEMALGAQLDQMILLLQEVAAGVARSLRVTSPAVPPAQVLDGHAMIWDDEKGFLPGPDADQIALAQYYAELAEAAALGLGGTLPAGGAEGDVLFAKPFPTANVWRPPVPADFMAINEAMIGKLVRISPDLDFEIVDLVDQLETLNYDLFSNGTGKWYNSSATATGALTADLDWVEDRVTLPNGKVASLYINARTGIACIRAYDGTAWTPLQRLSGDNIPCNAPAAGEYVRTTTGLGGALGTQAGVANDCDLYPWTPRRTVTLDRLSLLCTTGVAAATAKIVVFAASALGRADALILETATLDLATTGAKEAVITARAFLAGETYFMGVRHSSTATIATWGTAATPDLNGPTISQNARKVARRSLTYADAAPDLWVWSGAEIVDAATLAAAPAIFGRSV